MEQTCSRYEDLMNGKNVKKFRSEFDKRSKNIIENNNINTINKKNENYVSSGIIFGTSNNINV